MNTFHLVISTPDGNLFDEDAEVLSLRGAEGDLAIMAGHIPFITSVKPGTCSVTLADGSKKEGHTEGGLLTVSADTTILLSGSFHW
jgi:F0F1-type ATP synthase epsilon subunit